ncbi:hypothetical protein L1887_22649 [Cichorium endivia]|nr:hypothetical protein L1887_22649 [Cichorium endivia]
MEGGHQGCNSDDGLQDNFNSAIIPNLALKPPSEFHRNVTMATKVIMVRECFAALFRAFKLSSFIRKCYFPHRHQLPSLSLRLHQPLTTSSSRRSSLPTPPVHAVAAFHVGIRSYPNIQYCPCPLLCESIDFESLRNNLKSIRP